MYLSLKGSLGHTAITDRVGESLLQIAEGSSAAYSLRNLGSDSPSVVRVRRESDNAERDFTAQDINTSVVENWVNEQIIPPLDLRELTPTGRDGPLIEAAAAYSLRSLSDSYTGNVVEVRRTSDDQVRSFTAPEVTDGTLLAWVNTDVNKLDLQSETGSLVGNVTNKTATGFDFSVNNEGANGFKNLLPTATTVAGTYVITLDVSLNSGSLTGCNLYHTDAGVAIVTPLTAGANSLSLTSEANNSIFFYILGTAVADVSITNITLTQTSADGHVSTWYDQSTTAGVPNANHATQGTAASQPKIVDAGVLVTGGIDFDGAGQKLNTPTTSVLNIDGAKDKSIFAKGTFIIGESFVFLGGLGGNGEALRYRSTTGGNARFEVQSAGVSGDSLLGANGAVYSSIFSGTQFSDSDVSANGLITEAIGTLAINSADTVLGIGYVNGSTSEGSGQLSELIIYPSDQSDNRTALEANIGETYSITGIPAYDNTVNGFVEAWYDQSGNGYDAVQLTASQQPKIVDAGVKVVDRDGKVALNGKGAKLDLPNDVPMLSSDGTYSVFAVVDFDDQRNGNDNFNDILRFEAKTNGGASSQRKPLVFLNQSDGRIIVSSPSYTNGGVSYTSAEALSVQLFTNIANPALPTGNHTLYADGVLVNSSNLNTDVSTETLTSVNAWIFDNEETTVTHFLSEVIYYPSDESAKRVAIEDNIDNHYGITSAGSYVNAAGDSYINAAGDTYLQP